MKITIYELLGLIKDGKAPKKIKVIGNIYEFDEEYNFYTTQGTYDNVKVALGGKHGEINLLANALNENVEIIEKEKEIEKLKIEQDTQNSNYYIKNEYGTKCYLTKHSKMIAEKVNELIDEVKKLKEDK